MSDYNSKSIGETLEVKFPELIEQVVVRCILSITRKRELN